MPDIVHGQLIALTDNIHRITAANPSAMTAQGTNTYLLGRKSIAVVDPGPNLQEHIDAIAAGVAQLGGSLDYIVATHTHMDHSPAAAPLVERFGAKCIGKSPDDHQFQDETFKTDAELFDGYQLKTDEFSLKAIHTPGHVGNHYCLLEETNGMLFAGDHVMNGSSVVIIPPSGDMADYIDSTKKLLASGLSSIGPAHGDVITEPVAVLENIISHRLRREQKVISSLAMSDPTTIESLVSVVYNDVPQEMHGAAYFSLWAHLEKLYKEQRVERNGDLWSLRVTTA